MQLGFSLLRTTTRPGTQAPLQRRSSVSGVLSTGGRTAYSEKTVQYQGHRACSRRLLCGMRTSRQADATIIQSRTRAGESYLLLDRSLRELITRLAAPLAGRTRCGWPVSLVSWQPCSGGGCSGGGAVLHGPRGELLHCDR